MLTYHVFFTKDDLINARVWPVKQAKRVLDRIGNSKKPILLQTGYGPSGTPHLGTATEVIRTFMIGEVLKDITDQPVVIIAFCDDMDGMRKIPLNSPNTDLLTPFIGFPLSRVPDPSNKHSSFAEANIQKFIDLAQVLGYPVKEYRPTQDNPYSQEDLLKISGDELCITLIRSSDMYSSGSFDKPILQVLEKHQAILDLILPTLGDERRGTYSPFMPISTTGRVLETGVVGYYPDSGEIEVKDQGHLARIPVNGHTCKLQWKVDFGLRWHKLGIDYEMAGKDIEIGTNPISRGVCEILGSTPPINWMYEMFLASDGSKISKTKNNGLSLDQLLYYMPPSAIRHFMFLNPESAKRLDLSKIPRYLDDFLHDLSSFKESVDVSVLLENPIFYSRNTDLPVGNLTGSMVLSLIRGLNFDTIEKLDNHLTQTILDFNTLDREILIGMYRFYYEQYEKPNFVKLPSALCKYLLEFLKCISVNSDEMQQHLYRLGNEAVTGGDVKDLKTWFQAIYQSILGQTNGRRLGAFFAVCGPEKTHQLIRNACNGSD